jgi:hypothetical protein
MLLIYTSRTERASDIHLSVHGGGWRGRGSRHPSWCEFLSLKLRGLAASQPASQQWNHQPSFVFPFIFCLIEQIIQKAVVPLSCYDHRFEKNQLQGRGLHVAAAAAAAAAISKKEQ